MILDCDFIFIRKLYHVFTDKTTLSQIKNFKHEALYYKEADRTVIWQSSTISVRKTKKTTQCLPKAVILSSGLKDTNSF